MNMHFQNLKKIVRTIFIRVQSTSKQFHSQEKNSRQSLIMMPGSQAGTLVLLSCIAPA
jgi:hypothetical protein